MIPERQKISPPRPLMPFSWQRSHPPMSTGQLSEWNFNELKWEICPPFQLSFFSGWHFYYLSWLFWPWGNINNWPVLAEQAVHFPFLANLVILLHLSQTPHQSWYWSWFLHGDTKTEQTGGTIFHTASSEPHHCISEDIFSQWNLIFFLWSYLHPELLFYKCLQRMSWS